MTKIQENLYVSSVSSKNNNLSIAQEDWTESAIKILHKIPTDPNVFCERL